MIGYKAVLIENNFLWIIAKVEIPDDAIIVELPYSAYRTNKVLTQEFLKINFLPNKTIQNIKSSETKARSWFNNSFKYELNKLTESDLETNSFDDCNKGIYFFKDLNCAVGWALANLGEHNL